MLLIENVSHEVQETSAVLFRRDATHLVAVEELLPKELYLLPRLKYGEDVNHPNEVDFSPIFAQNASFMSLVEWAEVSVTLLVLRLN